LAVLVTQNLADHAGWIESGEPREIHRGLGVPHALQHSPLARPERLHVSAETQVRGHRGGIHRDVNRRRAVLRTDACRDAETRRRIHTLRVRGAVRIDVVLAHGDESELIAARTGEREAEQPARALGHEVDDLRRDALRRANEISFVLAILVVGHNHHAARGNFADRLFHRSERHCYRSRASQGAVSRCTYRPTRSASRCTRTSTSTASPAAATDSTTPTPSTCPCTICPPNRSPSRRARSRLTRSPARQAAMVVRSSVGPAAAAENHPDPCSRTVRHAPFSAMLSPPDRSS